MNKTKKILVFTATYNEKDNINELITSIILNNNFVDILIIDDNSPDKTYEDVEALQIKYKNIFLIKRPDKLGLDTAHKEAYDFAIKNNYELLITMDADLSHEPKDINKFIINLNQNPFVIGSRYMPGGKSLMQGHRLFMSKFGNKVIKFFLQINCNEFTTSFRGFNIKLLSKFHLNNVKTKGYSFFMGTLFEINKCGYRIKEIPIIFKDREKGISKIPKIELIRTLKNLFLLTIKSKFSFIYKNK